MTNIVYPAAPDFASEAPINLPANQPKAEYGSDLIAEIIGRLGHDYVFLTPGSSFRGLHDSLVNHTRNHKPQIILVPHEEMAVAMAQGYCKATGKPAMAILHDLVGVQHGLMAMYNAWADRQPVVVLGGSGPADPAMRRRIDWIHSANTQCELTRNFTKWTDEPVTLQATLDSIVRAQRVSASAPTGPTYVSIDTVIQESKISNGAALPDTALPRYRPTPPFAATTESLETAADILAEADYPLIAGGRIGYFKDITAPLVELVELTGAAYQDSHDIVCFPTAHPQNMNSGFGPTANRETMAKADAVLCIDVPDLNALLGTYGQAREHLGRAEATVEGKKVIDLSLNDLMLEHWSNLSGGLSPYDVQIAAEPHHGMNQLLALLKERAKGNPAWVKRAADRARVIGAEHEALLARQREAVKSEWDNVPISVPRMMSELWNVVKGKDYLLALRNYRSWYQGIWEFDGAGRHMCNNVGGGVGYGPGGVIGSALAGRDRGQFNLAILGDGDFTMGPGALWTAVHYRIPIMVVLHNNTSFGNDEEHQITLAHERNRPVENAWIGQRMVGPEPDYCGVARSYGAWAEQPVRDPKDLAAAFRKAADVVEKGGVALVDVHSALN